MVPYYWYYHQFQSKFTELQTTEETVLSGEYKERNGEQVLYLEGKVSAHKTNGVDWLPINTELSH